MLKPYFVDSNNASLLTDLYELTMAAAYWASGRNEQAVFELYFRRLPKNRSYIIAAGLEQALEYISNLHFSEEQLTWLKNIPAFRQVDPAFFDYLRKYRFSGDVWGIPEGTPVFPLEPFLQVQGPLIETQILETYLLGTVNVQSSVASKAVRMVEAAKGKPVVDFGTRRAHGPQAGLLAARASYIGGCIGTSNVLAGEIGGIPVYGTFAHSFVMSFPSELEAFQAYQRVFPNNTILLIDTYDTMEAAAKVDEVGGKILGVRIDSGDLLQDSITVRKILDEAGLREIKIFASGDLNEYKIESLIKQGAPIDIFGVGTELVTSYDDPALGVVYKLVEVTRNGKVYGTKKTSGGKISYPWRKQVYRFKENGFYREDLLARFEEAPPAGGTPLLQCYMRNGSLVEDVSDLVQIQERTLQEVNQLPAELRRITERAAYPVEFSKALREELQESASEG